MSFQNTSFSSKFAYFRLGFGEPQLRFFGSNLKIPKPKKKVSKTGFPFHTITG